MKTVYTYLVLDIIHMGHTRMLRRAREIAGADGRVIAGILTDAATMERKPRPILPFEHRSEIARAIRYIDQVIAQNQYSPVVNLRDIRPDILIESDSHTDLDIANSRAEMASLGGSVVVIPYLQGVSSTSIKNDIVERRQASRCVGRGCGGCGDRKALAVASFGPTASTR